eukprot:TRINITY_DN8936_c0_g1_i1.p1 TRINITY_DN8936_c0_g1~~TRINITY_DN8936_c0_g1_i1.p1  ORF type:complete len:232 (-),score=42.87 TRINITY_DN8936_c0_g1_i1:522-1127(-)
MQPEDLRSFGGFLVTLPIDYVWSIKEYMGLLLSFNHIDSLLQLLKIGSVFEPVEDESLTLMSLLQFRLSVVVYLGVVKSVSYLAGITFPKVWEVQTIGISLFSAHLLWFVCVKMKQDLWLLQKLLGVGYLFWSLQLFRSSYWLWEAVQHGVLFASFYAILGCLVLHIGICLLFGSRSAASETEYERYMVVTEEVEVDEDDE